MRTVKVSTFTVDSCIPELNFWFKMEVLKYRNSVPRINQIKFRTILMELHGSQNPDPNLTLDLLFLCLKNGRG